MTDIKKRVVITIVSTEGIPGEVITTDSLFLITAIGPMSQPCPYWELNPAYTNEQNIFCYEMFTDHRPGVYMIIFNHVGDNRYQVITLAHGENGASGDCGFCECLVRDIQVSATLHDVSGKFPQGSFRVVIQRYDSFLL